MNFSTAMPAAALLLLCACGGGGQAEATAEKLEEAAEQSDPAAAQVLENAAEEIREGNSTAPSGAPGSEAQQAMEAAGNAQAATLPRPQPAPPSLQAQPNRGGQQTPPPKAKAEGQ
jgi:hypothetical protein